MTISVCWQFPCIAGGKVWQGRAHLLMVSRLLCQIGSPCVSRKGRMAGEGTPAHSVTVTVSDWQSLCIAGRKEWQGRTRLLIVSLSLCQIGNP
ncbi:hypothetical protein PoB_007410600 [Plakobranchus ocellatus]|uniref:Uncharacterized protein n=1 Tax=Plakobranchus ocellatus TaxID=259542 RepID=A0AAV4DU49_9GAST|nr:hypothetical protein PoB_007410600 [Plakobranchus ocellatus]